MSLETLHLVLFLWVGACLVLLVWSALAFPRAVREHQRAAPLTDETVELRPAPEQPFEGFDQGPPALLES